MFRVGISLHARTVTHQREGGVGKKHISPITTRGPETMGGSEY